MELDDIERLEEDVRAIKAAKAVVIARGYIWGELGEALLLRKQAELDLMRGNAPRQWENGEGSK